MHINLYLLKNEDGTTAAEACEFSDHTVAVRWLPVGDMSGSLQFYENYVEWSYVAETLGKRKIQEIKENSSIPTAKGCIAGLFANTIDKYPGNIADLISQRDILFRLFNMPSAVTNDILKKIGLFDKDYMKFSPEDFIGKIYRRLVKPIFDS